MNLSIAVKASNLRAKLRTGNTRTQFRSLIAYGLGPIVGLASGPILARVLGPTGRGELAGIMQPISVAGAIASLGVPSAVAFYIGRGADPVRAYRRGVLCALPSAAVVYAFMLWYSKVVHQSIGVPVALLASIWSIVILSALIQVRRSFWQGMGQWGPLDKERLVFALVRFVSVVALVAAGIESVGYYASGFFASFCIGALLLWVRPRLPQKTDVTPAVISRRQIYSYSFRAAFGTIALSANNRLDQVLLPAATSSAQLGFYAVAVTVAEVPLIAATVASRNLLHEASLGKTGVGLWKEAGITILACIFGSIALAASAPFLIPLAFSSSFSPSVGSTQILLIGTALNSLCVCQTAILAGRGRPGIASWVNVSGLIITVGGFILEWENMDSLTASLIAVCSIIVTLVSGAVALRSVSVPQPRKPNVIE